MLPTPDPSATAVDLFFLQRHDLEQLASVQLLEFGIVIFLLAVIAMAVSYRPR